MLDGHPAAPAKRMFRIMGPPGQDSPRIDLDSSDSKNLWVPPATPHSTLSPAKQPKPRSYLIASVAVAIVLVMIGAAFVLTNGFHSGVQSSAVILIPDQSYYSISGGQFNAVAFVAHSSSVINGTFTNTLGVTVYVFTPSQLFNLSRTGAVSSYQWSSGLVANLTVDSLDVSVATGEWYLAFVNPSLVNTTTLGFYTAITVTPS